MRGVGSAGSGLVAGHGLHGLSWAVEVRVVGREAASLASPLGHPPTEPHAGATWTTAAPRPSPPSSAFSRLAPSPPSLFLPLTSLPLRGKAEQRHGPRTPSGLQGAKRKALKRLFGPRNPTFVSLNGLVAKCDGVYELKRNEDSSRWHISSCN